MGPLAAIEVPGGSRSARGQAVSRRAAAPAERHLERGSPVTTSTASTTAPRTTDARDAPTSVRTMSASGGDTGEEEARAEREVAPRVRLGPARLDLRAGRVEDPPQGWSPRSTLTP